MRHASAWWKPLAALVVAAIVALLLRHHSSEQQAIGAVFAATVVLWGTEALPMGVTSLLAMALLAIVAGLNDQEAFAGLGDPVIPLFISSLILAKAMEVTGLSKRVAIWLLAKKWVTASAGRLLLILGLLTGTISLLLSNTATTAMMLPIALGALHSLGLKGTSHPYTVALLLTLTFSANVSVGTPIGTPPDLIAIEDIGTLAGTQIGFGKWMAFGLPITALLLLSVWLVLRFTYRRHEPDTSLAQQASIRDAESLPPMTSSEKVLIWVLIVALILWLAPAFIVPIVDAFSPPIGVWFKARFTATVVGVLAAILLFAIPAKGAEHGRAIAWKDAVQIDWGVVLLLAAGITLGTALYQSGLARELGSFVANAVGASSLWTITALGIAMAILLSEVASNTASATVLIPVVVGIAQGADVSPVAPILGTAIGASLGLAFPFSTATNAIVFTTGLVPQKAMIKSALILDVIGFFVVFGCLRLILPWIGLA